MEMMRERKKVKIQAGGETVASFVVVKITATKTLTSNDSRFTGKHFLISIGIAS